MNLFFPKKRAKNTLSSLSAWICAHLRPILAFVLFFSIPAVSAAQDFTATALGDYGNVTVMEVAGSYDADLPDGTPNQLSRRVIAKEFYKTHKDEYDFLVIFTNFNFQMPYDGEAVAFYTHVKNDTLGIGKPAIDHTEAFGSNDKLQGTVDMGNVANLATDPFDPNFNVTLRTLTHELMHRWAASAKFRDIDGTDSSALLGKHGSHWSFLLDSQGSVLYGNRWQDNGDGTFTSLAPRREMDLYSPLELYLMGITDRSQVPPMLLIENPDVDHTRLPEAGVTINGTARTVTIDDIIAAMGERFPTPASSQKAFKSAFIFITSPGTFRGDEIYGIENIRNHGITRFSVLTDGKSIMEVASTQKEDIPVNPGVTPPTTTPRTVPPRLEDGVTWLVQAQRAEDGAWMDLSQTMERDTAVATLAVKSFPSAQQNYLGGIAWLKDAFSGNMDYLSRKIEALAGAGADVAPSIEELLSRQNADGGWGSEAHYTSNPLDTALAVRALTGAKHQDTAIISRAIDYLRSKQNPDNGWGSDDQGSTVQATSQVLSVFNSYRSAYQLEEQITSGIDMLVGRQNLNGDGGFGNSPSTVYDTAMAITTLRELGASTEITSRGAQYILDQQSENGSWYDSVYQTALAVSALLKATVEPDLSITSPDISFIPTTVTRLPVTITVTADVHNLGRTAATAKVFLYDGDPALGNRIGEQEAAFLGERATTVTFQAVVADGNTHYYYVVVDPDNSVKETSETNNQAVKVLYPEQTYDFAVTSLTVSPTAVEMFQNVTIRAEINNSGTTDGYAVQVRYYIDEPGAPFQIATRTLDLSSNGSVIDEFTWRANKAGADLPVTVVVDADNGYAGELSEDNNSATAALTVNIPVITNPNLEVSHNDLVITPNPVDEPASVSIALPVKNSGFSTPPENIQVNFYNGDPAQGGALLGGRTIQPLNQGESATVTFAWTDIQGSGDRLVYVKVDPDNVIPEVTEEDNSTFGTFHIRSLPDLVVSEHTISINPPAPSEEEDAVITVSIENAGEQTADDVLVTVFEGSTEIGSRTIASISGGSVAIASFTYPTSGKAGAHQITVSADPNGTVTEQHEDNNTVSKTFGVQNADLWLTEKYISPNGDGVQDSTQLFFRLDAPTTAVVHILNEQGDTVRILSSTGAVNTTGGSVIWDGLDNEGRVVGDGQYQATIVDGNGNAVHRVLIVVDNNRSPLLSAIGTPYLYRKNIGCNIPFYGQSWQWKNDESGFFVYGENINGQWYRQGLIDYSPDEQDWNVIDYYGWWTNSGFIGWSQDGSRFAVIRYSGSRTDGHDILVYDKQGDFLFNFNLGRPDRFSYKWSGDGATVAVAGIYDEYDYRLYINRTGYDNVVLTWGTQTERNTIKFDFAWSPDSSRLIYYDGNAEEIHVVNADGSNDTLLYSMSYPVDYLEWIDDERVLVSKQGHGTIVINTLDGTRTQISDLLLSSLSPDKTTMLMKEGPDTWVFVGIGGEVIDRFTLDTEFNDANVTRFYWSPDGKKTAWVQGDDLFIVGDERQNGIALHKSVPSIVAWLDGNNLSYITYTSPDSGEMQVYDTGANEYAVLQTFDDPSWSDSNGAVWLDFKISPLATYFSWRREFTNDNDCSFSYYLTRSLLNLTADFYVSKSDSSMILNGTAVDLNFEGWKLEYSSNGVDGWNPIVPFSDKPAIDEPIASWTPPVEGIFYVKLTAWDKAGNITETTKRVSSKKASNITSVYRTHDVFSPNGDDVKDTVELHYRALDAVHLDFTIVDEQGNTVRTFTKDHASATADYISWDGTNINEQTVPDGQYTITVLDYAFVVTVDTTAPDVNISFGPLAPKPYSSSAVPYLTLSGRAVDSNFKSWVIESGEGDNPQEWIEYARGSYPLAKVAEGEDPLVSLVEDAEIHEYEGGEITWLVGKKLRIIAEDFAGNKSIAVAEFIDEKMIVFQWDGIIIQEGAIPDFLAGPGQHTILGIETIRSPLTSMHVQHYIHNQWADAQPVTPLPGIINLEWNYQEFDKMRVKAIDLQGQEHYSNEFSTVSWFNINPGPCGRAIEARNLLPEQVMVLKIQVKSNEDVRYPQWTDYYVYDSEKGDSIPIGEFQPPAPAIQEGMRYGVRMVALGTSGRQYISNEAEYPRCPIPPRLYIAYETECNQVSTSATLGTILGYFNSDISLKSISYYITTAGSSQLLRKLDLTQQKNMEITVETASMAEGAYTVTSVVEFTDLGKDVRNTVSGTMIVDRVLPTAQITYPAAAQSVCPVQRSDQRKEWIGVPVEGIASDNIDIQKYVLYYGLGEVPGVWQLASTRVNGETAPLVGETPVSGLFGFWDITDLTGTEYALKLRVTDRTGNERCTTTRFTVDTSTSITDLAVGKELFSGIVDELSIDYETDEYAAVSVAVHQLVTLANGLPGPSESPIRTVVTGLQHTGGWGSTAWDGRADSGSLVPTGKYAVVVSIEDTCGNTARRWIDVEIDHTRPVVEITDPQPGNIASTLVEIIGTAEDAHFKGYVLEQGQGANPAEWTPIASGSSPVKSDIIGNWNTYGLDGKWTVRLRAGDKAGNQSETAVTFDLTARGGLIKSLDVAPALFSPNNDTKLDTTVITYELTSACDVLLEMTDADGVVRKTYSVSAPSTGIYTYSWDGKDDSGVILPDNAYSIKLSAGYASSQSPAETESITVNLDTTSPAVDITRPGDDSFWNTDFSVIGTVSDPHIAEYALSYTIDGGLVRLDQGTQSREDHVFSLLKDLPEGRYTLSVQAKDGAENTVEKAIPFAIDRTAPVVVLTTPGDGEYFGYGKEAVTITGSIVENNIETYSLRYGLGAEPTEWTVLSEGTVLLDALIAFTWNVGTNSGLADGRYTISLFAKDKAGQESEARVTVIIDNTAPAASITAPQNGDYVTQAIDITGTAFDENLDTYSIDISEGQCDSAFKWVTISTASAPVQNGVLAAWAALPGDGDYCLRVTAGDKLGNSAEDFVALQVDTNPPAAPVLSGQVENKTNSQLTWTRNTEPDVAGYTVYREGQKINTTLVAGSEFRDLDLIEGVYTYTVKAVDHAGWESDPSNEVKLIVDITPPDARIRIPENGAAVSDIVNIQGTAYSSYDFKQYRVYAGQGADPASWTLLRTSPVPISFGVLTQWDTIMLGEGPYSIKLEAEDLSGNVNTHQIIVTIDNTPPGAPVLVSAEATVSNVALTWRENSETDLAGYLLYRNGRLANASGIVIGDLKPYLLNVTNYLDESLPDGTFDYYLVAVDSAGNMSPSSNSRRVTIETRPPHAEIVEPAAGAEFEKTILIKTESADLDIASIQFQYKGAQETEWTDLGAPVTQSPFLAYLDPGALGLSYGDYHIQATAKDERDGIDPSPSSIMITYTDLTAPAVPTGLTAVTNGGDVTLTWTANAETDLDGYNIYREANGTTVKINTAVVQTIPYVDAGVVDGTYTYEVTAVDTFGNESAPSNSASARIYAPMLAQPFTPTAEQTIQMQGSNATADAGVAVYVEDGAGSVVRVDTAADQEGTFTFSTGLAFGENRVTAQATDSAGNISRVSNEVSVIHYQRPTAPINLTAGVQDFDVNLNWEPAPGSNPVGYHVYRENMRINASDPVTSGTATASSTLRSYYGPIKAFDSNTSSTWRPRYSYGGTFNPAWWQIELNEPTLISEIEVIWISAWLAGKDFEIQVENDGKWITLFTMNGNTSTANLFAVQPAYRTKKLRIHITDTNSQNYSRTVGLAEVRIGRDNPVHATSYNDVSLQDGIYTYTVTAVDADGFESLFSDEAEAVVGDVVPPSAPENLSASTPGPDVLLTWDAPPEIDVAGYNVYKNTTEGWIRLNADVLLSLTNYIDAGLLNGTYEYRVTAVDFLGNESLPSDEVTANVYVEPPHTPVIQDVIPHDAGNTLEILWTHSGSSAATFTIYRSTASGGPYTKINENGLERMSYTDTGLTNGTVYYYIVTAVDDIGNVSPDSLEAEGMPRDILSPESPQVFSPTVSGTPLTVYASTTDIAGSAEEGAVVDVLVNGITQGTVTAKWHYRTIPIDLVEFDLSPNGRLIAYKNPGSEIVIKDLHTGVVVNTGLRGYSPQWSPDGQKVLFGSYEFNPAKLMIYDLATQEAARITDGDYNEPNAVWSPDGSKIALYADRSGQYEIWIKDLAVNELRQVTFDGLGYWPEWSSDGERIVFMGAASGLYMVDLNTSETKLIDSGVKYFRCSRSGNTLVYTTGATVWIMDLDSEEKSLLFSDSSIINTGRPVWSPDGEKLLFVHYDGTLSNYTMRAWDVATGQSTNLTPDGIAWPRSVVWNEANIIAYSGSEVAELIYYGTYFHLESAELIPGENIITAVARDESGNESVESESITVIYDTSQTPDLSVTPDDIYLYPPYPIDGQEMAVNIAIWNRSDVEVNDANVDVYLWSATGDLEILKSETIASMSPQSAAIISATWDSTGMIGENRIIVAIDPQDTIAELDESNNMAIKDFFVVAGEGIFMSTTVNAEEFTSAVDMNINVTIWNSGAEQAVTQETWIEDASGYPVTVFESINATLGYGTEEKHPFTWNTGKTYAGAYQVRSVLKNASGIAAEETIPFFIVPDIAVDASLVTNKTNYGPHETVTLSSTITSTSQNTIIPALTAQTRIIDSAGNQVFTDEQAVNTLLPGANASLMSAWNTGLTLPGIYTAIVQVMHDDQSIATSIKEFTINAVAIIFGSLTVDPNSIPQGSTIQAAYTLANSGNSSANDLLAFIQVIDPDTRIVVYAKEDTITLNQGGAWNSQATIDTTGYALKTYTVIIQYAYEGNTDTLASATFTVQDSTPPKVTALAPEDGSYYNNQITLAVIARDDHAGVEKVEYRIDEGGWKLLPLADPKTGRYTATWMPTATDEGQRTISYRATDKAANTSIPVFVDIFIDFTPPAPPVITSPADGSFVSTDTVTILGTAEAGASITMGFGEDIRGATADLETGAFTFEEVQLVPGKNEFSFFATDRAGNKSEGTLYTLYLGRLEITKGLSTAARTLVWIGDAGDRDPDLLKSTRAFIDDALASHGGTYTIVGRTDEFVQKFRSGFYNTYIIVDLHADDIKGKDIQIHPQLQTELREAVHRGEGLILIKTSPSELPKLNEALGVTFKGVMNNIQETITLDSPDLGIGGTMGYAGDAVQATLTTGTQAAAYSTVSSPAMVRNSYGRGQAALFTFNPAQADNSQGMAAVLTNTLEKIKPQEPLVSPEGIVQVDIIVEAQYADFDVKVIETLPEGLELIETNQDPTIDGRTITWQKHLDKDTTTTFSYLVRLPDEAATYTTTTEIAYLTEGAYVPYETHELTITIDKAAATLLIDTISRLDALAVAVTERTFVEDAMNHLTKVRNRTVGTARDAERNIDDIIKAIQAVTKITTADTNAVRTDIDVLLRVWEIRWSIDTKDTS